MHALTKRKNQGQKEESDREGEIQEHRDAMENSKDSGNLVRPNLNTRCEPARGPAYKHQVGTLFAFKARIFRLDP
jgi:hypothetical protein